MIIKSPKEGVAAKSIPIDGLFHKVFDEIAPEYPDLQNEHWIVDIGAAKLADTPEAFDVVVMPNLYGDILSDVAAQIANSGDDTVSRLDPQTGRPIGKPIKVGRNPREVTVGLGFVWVANNDDNSVTRIDPRTGRVVGTAIPVGKEPLGIAAGSDSVWVVNHGDDHLEMSLRLHKAAHHAK